jgi:multidrug transporter EmrE-like cation transporter
VAVTVLLIPIGLALFREQLSAARLIGIAFCLIGLFLVARK